MQSLYSTSDTRSTIVHSITVGDHKSIAWKLDGGGVIGWNGSALAAFVSAEGGRRFDFSSFDYVVLGTAGIAATAGVNSTDYADDATARGLMQQNNL